MNQSKIELEAAIPFKNEFMPLANILYLILPYFLELKGIKYDESRVKKVFLALFNDSLDQLPKSIKNKEEAEHLSSLPTHKRYLKYLPKFMLHIKNDQFVKSFKVVEKKIFNAFFDIYTVVDSETFDESLEFILSKVIMLDNKSLRLVVKSINYTHADPVKSYEAHNSVLEKLNLKLFKSKNPPSNKEIEKLRIKDPEAYKELDKQRDIIKEKSWTIINDIWQNEIEEEFITSEEATELCNKAGIRLFPKEFKGMIRQNPVKGTELEFYSVNKERLDKPLSPRGFNLEMYDPKKHKSKGIFNCKFDLINEKGISVPQYRYTLATKAAKASDKFKKAMILGMEDRFDTPGDLLSKIREKIFIKDLESKDEKIRLCALLCIIGDMTCARLGTSKGNSDDPKAIGIHTCTGKTTVLEGSTLTISYLGKKGVPQQHTIPPSHKTIYSELTGSDGKTTIVELVIKELLQRKKESRGGYLFPGLDGKAKTISENTVNDYLKSKKVGWPGTYHLFRTSFGCKIFNREMMKLKGKTFTQAQAEEEFDRIVKIVSDYLGNTPEATIGSYIDKSLTQSFFEITKAGIPPRVLSTVEVNQGKLDGVRVAVPIAKEKIVKEKVIKKREKVIKHKIAKIGDRITILSDNVKEKGTIFKVVEKEGEIVYLILLDNEQRKRLSSDSEYILGIE